MKNKKTIFALGIILLFTVTSAFSLPKVKDILKKMDDMQNLKSDLSAKNTLTQQKAGQGTKVFKAIFYRRDKDDSFLILVTAPDSDKGNGYLKVGDNMWMYRRNTRTFQHINRDESISGTDAKGGDFEKRKLADLYTAALDNKGAEKINEEKLGNIDVYKFEVSNRVADVTYPKQVYWVRKDNYLPLKVQSYSLSGTLMQSSYYLQYTTIEGKYFLTKGMFVDEFEKGNKTIIDIEGISLNKLDDSIFSKAYLENISK